ncbi:hypothetical protein D0T49_03565 [Paludibacter sp. 221]|uniref:hypothetical protein n=1 Tax=Paludibacter sp. 221 TaxID=2302939 RepID=UPI0013D7FBC9|nr:hypothetical protein [Paludibacter sp. 221]NDV46118.1 hypothetical protein [Paludibacter sp. 221]
MAWLSKDKNGIETLWLCEYPPVRWRDEWSYDEESHGQEQPKGAYRDFPDGTFKSCPKWDENPIEI